MTLHPWLGRLASFLLAAACLNCSRSKPEPAPPLRLDDHAEALQSLLQGYADIAYASYRECWQRSALLQSHIQGFVQNPTGQSLALLRESWIQARDAYAQSQVFHFSGSPADALRLGNGSDAMAGWPIQAALIDTVRGEPNAGLVHNTADHPVLSEALLVELQQNRSEDEAFYLGFHVLEFLLWGEDLYGDSAGLRLHSDFTKAKNAPRRRTLLVLLANRLVQNAKRLADGWDANQRANYRERFLDQPHAESLGQVMAGVTQILQSGFEGRIERPLRSGSEVHESAAFSDTTHLDLLHLAMGVQNVWSGHFEGTANNQVDIEVSLRSFVGEIDPQRAAQIDSQLLTLLSSLRALAAPFDQLILEENLEGRKTLQRLDEQARSLGGMFASLAGRFGPNPAG